MIFARLIIAAPGVISCSRFYYTLCRYKAEKRMTDMNRKLPIVLLDLDDTILDFHAAERRALRLAFEQLGISTDERILDRYSVINKYCWEQLELGRRSREQILTDRFCMLFEEEGIAVSGAQAQAVYEGHLCEGHFFVPGAPELLETLRGKYRLFIISNGNIKTQAGRLASAGISPYFENIFISEAIGCNKPSVEFFERCIAQIPDFDRRRAIVVGDSLSSDIRGGINAGIMTCWFAPHGKAPGADTVPDHIITALPQLPGLLERVFNNE